MSLISVSASHIYEEYIAWERKLLILIVQIYLFRETFHSSMEILL